MIRTRFILLLCVVSAVIPGLTRDLRAQDVMSLHDCMEYAISNSTKIRIQQAAIGDARIARRDALLSVFLPSVNAGTSASYSFGRNIDPETNTYINTISFSNGYSVSAGITLFNGFAAVNNLKIAQTALKMGETQERQTEADICLAVMEAYYNVVYYKRLCDIYDDQVAAAETALTKALRQEELGLKGHADVIQMEAELADRQYDRINTFNMYDHQRTILADLMFWPVEEELVIDFSIPLRSSRNDIYSVIPSDRSTVIPSDRSTVIPSDHPTVIPSDHPTVIPSDRSTVIPSDRSTVIPSVVEESPESVVEYALTHNPDILLADWTRLNAKRELSTAKWQMLPSVSLNGGWSTSYYNFQGQQQVPYLDLLKRNGGEYVSLSISVPIFNRLSRQSSIARKRNALDKANAEYDQKRRDVESEVRRAIQDRDGAATAYQQAQRKAEVQEEAYTLNMKKLEQGLISPLEFQTAGNNYLKAQADEMNSLFKYLIKQAVVQYYNGVEYIDQ